MTAVRYRHRRTSNATTAFPGTLEPGEIAANTANRQLAIGDAAAGTLGAPVALLAVRYFDVRAKYAVDDLVQQGSNIFRARVANGPGSFNVSNWSQLTFPDANTALLPIAGGTMTGPLQLAAGEPSTITAAAPKNYVDNADALKADKTYVDTQDAAKADKTYVDTQDALKAPLASPTFTGDPKAPTPTAGDNDTSIATTAFVKNAVDTGDALKADKSYVDTQDALALAKTGGTMSGHITLPTSPAAANAVRKDYVDAAVAGVTPVTPATLTEYLKNDAAAALKPVCVSTAWGAGNATSLTESGGAVTPDMDLGIDFIWVPGGAGRTINNMTHVKQGQRGVILIFQNATGSATITTWGNNYYFPGGIKPQLTTTPNGMDVLSYEYAQGRTICSWLGDMK